MARPGTRGLPGKRWARPGSQAVRRGSVLRSLLRLMLYAVLLLLTAKVAWMAWDAVAARRAELLGKPEAAEVLPPRVALVSGGQDRWMDASLASVVGRVASSSSGATAVYVKSLNTGASTAQQEDAVYVSASLFKVPILVEVLRQQGLGLLDMGTRVRLQQKHWADGSGVLQAQIGKEFPVRELLDLMIGVSDNVAALALLDLVGTDNVNLTLQANGLEATRLRIGSPARNWGGRPGENTTTAREMGALLEKIATGAVLGERGSEEAIRLLSQKQQASWLPALLPPGVRVAHKSGELPGIRHDAGVVYTPRSQFVAVVLVKDLTDYDAAAQAIARVARAAHDYFETGKSR